MVSGKGKFQLQVQYKNHIQYQDGKGFVSSTGVNMTNEYANILNIFLYLNNLKKSILFHLLFFGLRRATTNSSSETSSQHLTHPQLPIGFLVLHELLRFDKTFSKILKIEN